MSKIKSALELAMEKTAHLKADPRKLQIKEIQDQSKRRVSLILSGEKESTHWEDYYTSLSDEDKKIAQKSAVEVVASNFNLPRHNEDLKLLPQLQSILELLHPKKKELIGPIFDQASGLFQQYMEGREQVEKSLMEQVEQQLRQKEAMLSQQSGRQVHLTPQDDPELMKAVSQQIQSFEEQYKEVIDKMKQELQQLF